MFPFLHRCTKAFSYAFSGLWYLIRTQRNAWIHSTASIAVVGMSFWLGISARDWALIVIAIAMVWTSELINTALEAVVDLASPEHHTLAKVSKDVGAAAVLIAAISSVIIGLLILGTPLWEKIRSLAQF